MIQLIYASAATVDFSDADLKKLLAASRKNNEALDISGMLLHHEHSFLQILEGEEDVVLPLYAKIMQDPRHDEVKLLLRSTIDERSFGDWKMGFYKASETPDQYDAAFVDFLRKGYTFDGSKGDQARSVLVQFREGNWRQRVNIED